MAIILKNGKFFELKEIKRNIWGKDTSVYSILKSILEKQNLAKKQVENNETIPSPSDIEGDTIPILLYSSFSAEPLTVYGNIGHCLHNSCGPFKTSFFRIEELINNSFACLSLMCPLDESGELADSILNTYSLEKTKFRIEAQLENILMVQCASPKLVNRELVTIEQKF